MWPIPVVIGGKFGEDDPQERLSDRDGVVKTFGSNGLHDPLGDGVRPRGFGTVDGHFFVAYNPGFGDETALAATVHMALVQALARATAGTEQAVDLEAARRDLSHVRKLLEEFDAIETAHSGAVKCIQKASAVAFATRVAILKSLGKLDSILMA